MRHKAAVFFQSESSRHCLNGLFYIVKMFVLFFMWYITFVCPFNRKYSSPCSSTRNNSRTLSLIDNDLQPEYLIFYGNVLCIITFFIYIIQIELNVQLFFNLSRARGSTIYYLNNIRLSYTQI